jgi:hypothetical protein
MEINNIFKYNFSFQMFLTNFLSHQVNRLYNWRPRTGINNNCNSTTLAACSEQAGAVEGCLSSKLGKVLRFSVDIYGMKKHKQKQLML